MTAPSALALLALLAGAPPAASPDVLGTFRVRATVRADALSLAGPVELRGDVVVRPGVRPREVAVTLAARGYTCQLAGRAAEAGALTFPAGQPCTLVLEEPEARGRVVASLRAGRGRVDAGGRLTLALDLELAGAVRIPTGLAGIPGLQGEAELPVGGGATLAADGARDNSRAAD